MFLCITSEAKHTMVLHFLGTIDMDLITTGVSASERMKRDNLASATRNIIMEKMQLGGPSMRLLEVMGSLNNFWIAQCQVGCSLVSNVHLNYSCWTS